MTFYAKPDQTYREHIEAVYLAWKETVHAKMPLIERMANRYSFSVERCLKGSLLTITLHDIGKIGIPDVIMQKPAKLSAEEWKIVHTHPKLGAELISPIKKLANVSPMIEFSHERYDGRGYPYGIRGEAIPLGARIISVVDSYSAMLDRRPYKEPYSVDKIVRELKQNAGKMYDPKVVEAFLIIIQETGDDITL